MFADKSGEAECVRIKLRGERETERGRMERPFSVSARPKRSCYRAGQYLPAYPTCVLHFNYVGRYMLNMETLKHTCAHKGSKYNHDNSPVAPLRTTIAEFILRYIICLVSPPPVSIVCYCEIFSPQPVVIHKAHLHLSFTPFHLCHI